MVSIITVNYNGWQDTCELIASLKQHETYPYEVIVVDNASAGDDAERIRAAHPEAKVVRSDVNLGFAGGNNLGYRYAKGDCIFFLNNDMVVKEAFLQPLVRQLEVPGAGALSPCIRYYHHPEKRQYCGYQDMTPITLRHTTRPYERWRAETFLQPFVTEVMHGAAMLVRRDVIERVGTMTEVYFLFYEEFDWSRRIREAGFVIWCVPGVSVYHKESMSIPLQTPFREYYIARSRMIYARRNNQGIARLLSCGYLLGIALPKRMYGYLVKGKWSLIGAVLRGTWKGLWVNSCSDNECKMKIYIKSRKRHNGQFQFYMNQFVEAAVQGGCVPKSSLLYELCFHLSTCLSKGVVWGRKIIHRVSQRNQVCSGNNKMQKSSQVAGGGIFRALVSFICVHFSTKGWKRKGTMIVTSRGDALLMNAFPFFCRYEIVPMLWDVWPATWERLQSDLKLLQCKRVFITVRSMAEKITKEWGIPAYWIPEGMDVFDYEGKGNLMPLCNRRIEVYELGRQLEQYHQLLQGLCKDGTILQYRGNEYDANGRLLSLAFPAECDMATVLRDVQVVVSFPQIDTHPEKAGNLETLTQRYWEAMLSGCVIVGRAPQELIDLIGYNPVLDVDWENPSEQLKSILYNIATYQNLVDKNCAIAQTAASWRGRIERVLTHL